MSIKTSLFYGAITSLIISFVDVSARIILWSFEWFELYQAFITTFLMVMPVYILAGITVALAEKFLKPEKKRVQTFFISLSVMLLLGFYQVAFITQFSSFETTQKMTLTITGIILSFTVFLLMVSVFKKHTVKLVKLIESEKSRKIVENALFITIIFITISLIYDAYNISTIPELTSSAVNKPNIILISLDTVRGDSLTNETSPNIQELSEKSLVFDNAVSASSWTLPSHASMFTGEYPDEHGATRENQVLAKDEKLLAEVLREDGYITSGFVGAAYCKAKYGLAQGMMYYNDRLDFIEYAHIYSKLNIKGVGLELYNLITTFLSGNKEQTTVTQSAPVKESQNFSPITILKNIGFTVLKAINKYSDVILLNQDYERTSDEINKDVFEWLDKNGDETFFLFINYFDAHSPYNLGEEFRYLFTNQSFEFDSGAFYSDRYVNTSENTVEQMMALYKTEIHYLDSQIGELLDKLEETGLMNNTLIIITADHGEEFKEHGAFGHGDSVYQEVIHVPLIIYYPEASHETISERVSSTTLFSTILNYTNNYSLNITQDEIIYSELFGRIGIGESEQIAVFKDDWKLINVTPENAPIPKINSSLHNLKTDPEEQINLYNTNITKRAELENLIN